ncbi:hypothetical protein Glove_143g9 [Diversispora epigaea]|uniref:Arb2 domain-containing protein n=1 Tax=Diversispora epigaea TaxID=1348612 RepID=A0A397J3E5_9GLOM|nr:hypothetical protein Glove_143g9 [Diversispora epigaea]
MFRRKKEKKPVWNLPRDLTELGYLINEEGQLRTIKDNEPYVFDLKEKAYNEALYDVLIDLLGEWVEEKLVSDVGMLRILLPLGVTEAGIHTKIYVTPDYQKNEKMMVFIPGTAHTVGIWSRRVLTDTSIVDGSMITYTKRAISMGYSVVICNPNEVFWYKGKGVLILPRANVPFDAIPGSESPEEHTAYVFKNIIIPSPAKKIFTIANSYGGHCAINAVQSFFNELKDRVKAIEFTASTHSIDFVKSDKLKVWIHEHCRNWIMSDLPVGKEVLDTRFGCVSLSSGAELNEYVIATVIDQVFDFIDRKSKLPDNWHESVMAEEIEEETPEQLDLEAQRLFADNSLVNDVQDKIQYDGYPVLEEVENSAWVQ